MTDQTVEFLPNILADRERERVGNSPSVRRVYEERQAEQTQLNADDMGRAIDAFRGSSAQHDGPAEQDYDYVSAYRDGTDFNSGDLPNRYRPPYTYSVQGYDIANGHNVIDQTLNPNEEGRAFDLAGVAKLRESKITPEGGAPDEDMPALAQLAMGAQLQGVETYEEWRSILGDNEHSEEALKGAWSAAVQVGEGERIQQLLEEPNPEMAEKIVARAYMREPGHTHWGQPVSDRHSLPEIPPEELVNEPAFLEAARTLYRFQEGGKFPGSDQELSEYAQREMSAMGWNTVTLANHVVTAMQIPDEGRRVEYAQALLDLIEFDERVPVSLAATGRALKEVVTDEVNYASAFVGGLAAKGVQLLVGREIAKKLLLKVMTMGAVEGGVAESARAVAEEQLEVEAGKQEEIDLANVARSGAMGTALGAVAGGVLEAGLPPLFRAGRNMVEDAASWQYGVSPWQRQRGAIGNLGGSKTPAQLSAAVDVREALDPVSPTPAYFNLDGVPLDADLNREAIAKGVGLLPDDRPLVINGRDIPEWTADDFTAFGEAHGVENFGPLTKPVKVKGTDISIPGGLKGKFTYLDMLWLKTQGYNPNDLPDKVRVALYKKLARTTTPEPHDEIELFNRFLFGMLSPNQPLTPNEIEYSRLRAMNMEQIQAWANLIPWEPGDKVSKEVRLAANRELAKMFQTQAGKDGGMGLKGTADYTSIAEFAKLYAKDPLFFKKSHNESWHNYVERVMSQTRGLSAKVASFSTVWQDPLLAEISAVDRHMGTIFREQIFNTPEMRNEFEQLVINRFNSKVSKGTIEGEPTENFDELMLRTGGSTVFAEVLMSYITKSPNIQFRTAKGEINPNVPEHLREVNWVMEPEKVNLIGEAYKQALALNDKVAQEQGLHLFASQWMLWDKFRGRIEPHEVMFPGLYKLPKPSRTQLENAHREHTLAGFSGSASRLSGKLDPLTKLPAREKVPIAKTKRWEKHVKDFGGMNWKRTAYWSILPMLDAGGAFEAQEELTDGNPRS